ncbi:uncharacterized protein LOC133490395 [Syngnathoides biaculeatus]|uniref:uncharacterized protein LOC133490395 n=1 Tax=Syngnathoides biaculeatus TaxID=300417 RepID=UPI002ADE272E|nr:uncharacterized protein LOC133490395 [Syngnathoides biaculeatus]
MHHLQNVTWKQDKAEPKMITKKVEELAMFINPAVPKSDTLDLIMGNAKNWGYNTLLILENHYKDTICETLGDIFEAGIPNWRELFDVATRWAYRNTPNLKKEIIEQAEALFVATSTNNLEWELERTNQQNTEQPTNTNTDHDPDTQPQEAGPPNLNTENTQTTVTIHIEDNSTTETGHIPTDDREQHTLTKPTETRGTMTEAKWEWSPIPTEPRNSPEPRDQRPTRPRTDKNTCVIPEGSRLMEISREEAIPQTEQNPAESSDGDLGELLMELARENEDPPTPAMEQSTTSTPSSTSKLRQLELSSSSFTPRATTTRDHDGGRNAPLNTSELRQLELTSGSFTPGTPQETTLQDDDGGISTPTTSQQALLKVRKHLRTQQKMKVWQLRVLEKNCHNWGLQPEQNTELFHPDLQIESYPGANFHHTASILSKTKDGEQAEQLVLSFGINCRCQKIKKTTIKQIQTALRTARIQFPNARIWIQELNFSNELPEKECLGLCELNKYIRKNTNCIPKIKPADFTTGKDHIHWTKTTATYILEHWANHLNL